MDRAQEMERLRYEIDALEDQAKTRKERYRELSERIIPDLMETVGMVDKDGKGSMSMQSGSKIYLKSDAYVNCRAEDKPALLRWLRSHKLKDMIRQDVNAQTLKAFCKEQFEDDEPLPPMITMHFVTNAQLRRK
jgi:hypothetical protein